MLRDYPLLVFVCCIVLLLASAWLGARLRGQKELQGELREDFGVVLTSALTLLGLIVGFSFSMATSRYDLRKNYEEAEANAIGTEYVRLDLLTAEEASTAKKLLRSYIDQRVLWYRERDAQRLQQIDDKTVQLQNELWAAVKGPAATRPSPVSVLVVTGMNDVLNSQGYTQAAWWNRIPRAAWILMLVIAIVGNTMIGYSAGNRHSRNIVIRILPVIASIAFYLIADIDSPRGGMVRVVPQNLLSLVASLPP
jgi:hypothetical protein